MKTIKLFYRTIKLIYTETLTIAICLLCIEQRFQKCECLL